MAQVGSVNRMILLGRITRINEPKIYKKEEKDILRLKINVATNEIFGDKKYTTFHDVVIFGKLAEEMFGTLKLGKLVYVEGKLSNYYFDTGGDYKTKIVNIVVEKITLLEKQDSQEKPQEEKPVDKELLELPEGED